MKNVVIAKRQNVNESEMFVVYVKSGAATLDRMLISTREKALKYAFILKRKHEAIITKAAMATLRRPQEQTPAEDTPATEPAEAPAEVVTAAEEPKAAAPVTEEKPAPKKRGRKPTKKSNAEAL